MIIFHEGLPRSGKSYEAMTRHVFAALQAGRKVYAYVEGINHEKIGQVLDMPTERVRDLLHQINADDVQNVWSIVEDNSLVVLDEAQDFWPTGRTRLGPEMTKFITQHGHRGLDILLMGQVLSDVHKLWRGRVSQKVLFHKLDAVGLEQRYAVTVYKATAPEKFVEISKTTGVYDAKYFGTYASHVSDATNTLNYKDDRANVRNAWWVRWGLPLAVGLAAWGVYTAWSFFHPTAVAKPLSAASAPASAAPAAAPPPRPASAPSKPKKGFVEELNDRYRPRLAYVYQSGNEQRGAIEWWDGDKLRERLSIREIVILGGSVEVWENVARVSGTWVTAWPVDRAHQLPTVGAQVVPVSTVAAGL